MQKTLKQGQIAVVRMKVIPLRISHDITRLASFEQV